MREFYWWSPYTYEIIAGGYSYWYRGILIKQAAQLETQDVIRYESESRRVPDTWVLLCDEYWI